MLNNFYTENHQPFVGLHFSAASNELPRKVNIAFNDSLSQMYLGAAMLLSFRTSNWHLDFELH
jgi:hypothetical protein